MSPTDGGRMENVSAVWNQGVIDDIAIKAEIGRYRMRGFNMFKRIPHFDDLTFLPATLTRFVIEGYREKCETKTVLGSRLAERPLELEIPIYITGMSFGALSRNAKIALAKGATMAGTCTCSGEGGAIPEERRYSERWIYQIIQSRYGFNPYHLRQADMVEFFISQGCKPGAGGHLMGQKVSPEVAAMRDLPPGIDQRSPVRHPDWLGPDDLKIKAEEIREATDWKLPIQFKIGTARAYDDVRMAAKCGPDTILIDGMEGSTGAGPHILTEETGIPLMAGIAEARRALEDVGMVDEIDLVASGGVRNGADVAKCLALGAKAVAVGTAPLIAMGSVQDPDTGIEAWHTGRDPSGITTQDPELVARLDVEEAAQRVYNLLHAMTLELQMLARGCGKTDVHNLEPEDLAALTVEAGAMCRVPLAGTSWVPGQDPDAEARDQRLERIERELIKLRQAVEAGVAPLERSAARESSSGDEEIAG
jgi:glutamate synthase domain-containing protein 2